MKSFEFAVDDVVVGRRHLLHLVDGRLVALHHLGGDHRRQNAGDVVQLASARAWLAERRVANVVRRCTKKNYEYALKNIKEVHICVPRRSSFVFEHGNQQVREGQGHHRCQRNPHRGR